MAARWNNGAEVIIVATGKAQPTVSKPMGISLNDEVVWQTSVSRSWIEIVTQYHMYA